MYYHKKSINNSRIVNEMIPHDYPGYHSSQGYGVVCHIVILLNTVLNKYKPLWTVLIIHSVFASNVAKENVKRQSSSTLLNKLDD